MTEQQGGPFVPSGGSASGAADNPWQVPPTPAPSSSPPVVPYSSSGHEPPQYPQGPLPYQGGYPQYPYASPAQQGTNGFSVASLVLGIVWVYWLGSILALIFGYVAMSQIKKRGGGGRGLAIAGVVLGWVGIATLILVVVVGVAVGHDSSDFSFSTN